MKTQLLTLAVAITATTLCSCGGKEKAQTVVTKNGTTVEVPAEAHAYTAGERKAKKEPTASVLTFHKSLADAKGQIALADKEFEGNTNLVKVISTNHITNIAPYAFGSCTNLTEFTSTELVDVVNDNAFEGCTALKAFNAETRTVGINGFADCVSLESFKMVENPYQLREGAFKNCTSLKKCLIGMTLTKMEEGAFEGCSALEELSIPFAYRKVMFGWVADCSALQKVYLLTTEAFDFPESGKAFPAEQVSLYVPDAFLDKFKGNSTWGRFKEILPLSQSESFDAMGMAK